MIGPNQATFIESHIYSSDQDYFYWSTLLGEPFLSSQILHYYDGEMATFIGYPFRDQCEFDKSSESQMVFCLKELIREWAYKPDVKLINYRGIWHLDDDFLADQNFRPIMIDPKDMLNVDVFATFPYDSKNLSSSISEGLRKARKRELVVKMSRRIFWNAQHISLLRQVGYEKKLTSIEMGYLINALTILRSPSTMTFECWRGDILTGFAVTHSFFKTMPFFVCAAYNKIYSGTSDLLYHSFMNYYNNLGALRIGLGHTIDKQLYTYKTKWPNTQCNLPFSQTIWIRGNPHIQNQCFYWGTRLLGS